MSDFVKTSREPAPLKYGIICLMKEQTRASSESIYGNRERNAAWLSGPDREALSRSAEDVRQEKFATDAEVRALFDRYRRRRG